MNGECADPAVACCPCDRWEAFHTLFRPSEEDLVRQRERYGAVLPESGNAGLSDSQAATGEPGHTGFAFSANESTATVTQAEVIRRYDTTVDKPEG